MIMNYKYVNSGNDAVVAYLKASFRKKTEKKTQEPREYKSKELSQHRPHQYDVHGVRVAINRGEWNTWFAMSGLM
jgi:hypothetical protein